MQSTMNFTGIDGCRGGWFCVTLKQSEDYQCHLVAATEELVELVAGANVALIDIPIGLVGSGLKERSCDKAARGVLGAPRAASVFTAPARAVLAAETYDQALVLNRQGTGRGLSIQAWNITSKIREVDNVLRNYPGLQGRLRECHPEVCFWALNAEMPMVYNKKTREGYDERLAVLKRFWPPVSEMIDTTAEQFPRSRVAIDDIVDALALAVTARLGRSRLMTLPSEPPLDDCGLAMEIVYAEPN